MTNDAVMDRLSAIERKLDRLVACEQFDEHRKRLGEVLTKQTEAMRRLEDLCLKNLECSRHVKDKLS